MDGLFRQRHLPHWDVEGAPYFVTACLAGSVSAAGLLELDRYRAALLRQPRPATISEAEWQRRIHKLVFARLDGLIDGQPAVKHFARPDLAVIVRDSMAHFDQVRYISLAWVIMPSHLHWLFQPLPTWSAALPGGKSPREVILHSLKSFTSNECNRVLGQRGAFWQQESYDHWIRDEKELERVVDYIGFNPVRAGLAASLEEYPFSSAFKGIP